MENSPSTRNQSSEAVNERRQKALALHLAGVSYPQIAKIVGFASHTGAMAAVKTALEEQKPALGEEELRTQLARINAMLQGLWPQARKGDPGAVDRVLRLEERRTQLLTQAGAFDPPEEPSEPASDPDVTKLADFQRRLAERERQRRGEPDLA